MKQKTKKFLSVVFLVAVGFILGLASMAESHKQSYNIGFYAGYNTGYQQALEQF